MITDHRNFILDWKFPENREINWREVEKEIKLISGKWELLCGTYHNLLCGTISSNIRTYPVQYLLSLGLYIQCVQ